VLTGLFLSITLSGPQGPPETDERTLFDRIGYAARQGLVAANVSISPGSAPALNSFDAFTLNVMPSLQDPAVLSPLADDLGNLSEQVQNNSAGSASSATSATGVVAAYRALTTIASVSYLADSDFIASQLGASTLVMAYADRPREVLTSVTVAPTSDQNGVIVTHAIDLRRDSVRTLALPGQDQGAVVIFNATRGMLDSELESEVLPPSSPADGSITAVSTFTIFQAASDQGVALVNITSDNLTELDSLSISPEAKARITTAVNLGKIVLVPSRSVTIDGVQTVGWFETDPTTGDTIGVTEDGGHQGITQFTAVLGLAALLTASILTGCGQDVKHSEAYEMGYTTGKLAGSTAPGKYDYTHPGNIGMLADEATRRKIYDKLIADEKPEFDKLGPNSDFESGFKAGAKAGLELPKDPPLGTMLSSPAFPFTAGTNQASSDVKVATAATAGHVAGTAAADAVSVSGQLAASWADGDASGFAASALAASGVTVTGPGGSPVGSGAVALTASPPVPVAISGNARYSVSGSGTLAFYGSPGTSLGVGGDWVNYSATVSGTLAITLTTGGLSLNGQALPAGTYTLTAASATLSGSGPSTAPNFAGTASITVTGGTVNLGLGTGNVAVGGTPLDPTNGATLTGYSGTLNSLVEFLGAPVHAPFVRA
jgi:hypothetical protein